ncbi:hypothetical protein ACTFIY_000164 [Dictyostelium cf. discoideum]
MNIYNNILVTGGAGFVGSHLCIFLVKNYENSNIICIDNLEYRSNLKNLNEIINNNDNLEYSSNLKNLNEIINNNNLSVWQVSEHLVNCYRISFKLPTIITRSNNLFGEFQYPEKAIPKFITQLLNNEKITIQGNGDNLRSYLYINEIINAYNIILKNGKIGETYNVGTLNELSTIDLAKNIIDFDRPINDKRYDVNFQKLKDLGWKTIISFEDSIEKTYDWIKSNKNHWNL